MANNLKQLQQNRELLREQRKQTDLLRQQNRLMAQQNRRTTAASGPAGQGNDTSFMGTMGKLAGAVGGALGETLSELREDFRTSGGVLSDHVKKEIAKGQQGGDMRGEAGATGTTMGETFLPPTGPANPLLAAPVWHHLINAGKPKAQLDTYAHPTNALTLQTYLETLDKETKYPFTASIIAINLADAGVTNLFIQSLAKYPQLYGSVGFGPRQLMPSLDELDTHLTALLNANPKIIAMGPVGLDAPYAFHTLPQQVEQLRLQLEIAADFGLPVFLRNIDATSQLAAALKDLPTKPRALIYTRPPNTPEEKALIEEHDMYILLRSEFTWPEQKEYRQIAMNLPKLRWLLSSGNGLTASEANKGQTNTSTTLPAVIQALASVTAQDEESLLGQLNSNAYRLFYNQ